MVIPAELVEWVQTGGVWVCAALMYVQGARYRDLADTVRHIIDRLARLEVDQ